VGDPDSGDREGVAEGLLAVGEKEGVEVTGGREGKGV